MSRWCPGRDGARGSTTPRSRWERRTSSSGSTRQPPDRPPTSHLLDPTGCSMARDYEDIHDIDDLNDDELTGLVREHLAAHKGLDVDDIAVRTADGVVHLEGRVGTEAELRIAERV